VLARDGNVNARSGDIAEEAGKATGFFYQCFRNNEDFLFALAKEFRIALRDNINRPGGIDGDPFENCRWKTCPIALMGTNANELVFCGSSRDKQSNIYVDGTNIEKGR
jgi:hypothetical protein